MALARALPVSDPLRGRLREAIARGGRWLLQTQLHEPPELEGAFPGADPRGGLGGQRGQVRVDFTQHALSALLGWRALSSGE